MKLFTDKIKFLTYYLHLLNSNQLNFCSGVFENAGYIDFYSWKVIFTFPPIYLFLLFYLLVWQNFELTCTKIIFEFQISNVTSQRYSSRVFNCGFSFWCRSVLVSLVFQPATCIKNLLFNIMRCTTAFNEVLSHWGKLHLMLEILVVTFRLVWPKKMELHALHVTLYTTWDFRFLSEDGFRVSTQVLSFLVVKVISIPHNFFSLLATFWVLFPLYCTKNLDLGSLLLTLLNFLRCCSFWGVCCDLFPRDYFIQRLVKNTGGPFSRMMIFSPDLLNFLESYNKGVPVSGRIKNSMHSPLNHIFLML